MNFFEELNEQKKKLVEYDNCMYLSFCNFITYILTGKVFNDEDDSLIFIDILYDINPKFIWDICLLMENMSENLEFVEQHGNYLQVYNNHIKDIVLFNKVNLNPNYILFEGECEYIKLYHMYRHYFYVVNDIKKNKNLYKKLCKTIDINKLQNERIANA